MTWDDLEMVTLRQASDRSWSFTVYRTGFVMWRSNSNLPDVFACIEQIQGCLEETTAEENAKAAAAATVVPANAASSSGASGGMGSKPAGGASKPRVKIRLSGEAEAVVRNAKRRR